MGGQFGFLQKNVHFKPLKQRYVICLSKSLLYILYVLDPFVMIYQKKCIYGAMYTFFPAEYKKVGFYVLW